MKTNELFTVIVGLCLSSTLFIAQQRLNARLCPPVEPKQPYGPVDEQTKPSQRAGLGYHTDSVGIDNFDRYMDLDS